MAAGSTAKKETAVIQEEESRTSDRSLNQNRGWRLSTLPNMCMRKGITPAACEHPFPGVPIVDWPVWPCVGGGRRPYHSLAV